MTDRSRFTVSVDKNMFRQIEDFRFQNRYQTRSQAVIAILEIGLLEIRKQKEKKEKKEEE